jgi:hypothetical protein
MQWHGDLNTAVKPLTEVCPWIPQPLSRLLEQMLSKDAAGRPAGYQPLMTELESIRRRIEDTHHVDAPPFPVTPGGKGGAGKKADWWQDSRSRMLLMAAGLVVLIVVMFFWGWMNSGK